MLPQRFFYLEALEPLRIPASNLRITSTSALVFVFLDYRLNMYKIRFRQGQFGKNNTEQKASRILLVNFLRVTMGQ